MKRAHFPFLIVATLIVSFASSFYVYADPFFDSDYQRAQSQAREGFREFDKEFETEFTGVPAKQHSSSVQPSVVTKRAEAIPASATTEVEISETVQPKEPPVVNDSIEKNGFSFNFQGCDLSSSRTLICKLMVTSLDTDKRLSLNARRNMPSRVFDEEGNEYWASYVVLTNKKDNYMVRGTLVAGIKAKASVIFENFPVKNDALALLEVNAHHNGSIKLQFRDVKLDR